MMMIHSYQTQLNHLLISVTDQPSEEGCIILDPVHEKEKEKRKKAIPIPMESALQFTLYIKIVF